MNWKKIRYVKGILPYFHRISVFFSYLLKMKRLKELKGRHGASGMVAIVMIEHFGDIVACEPVARYARQTYPSSRIVWVVRDAYAGLVEHNPAIDSVLTVTCLTEWILLSQQGIFDHTINLHPQNRQCPVCQKLLVKTTGNLAITPENYYHYGNLLSAFCQSAGIPVLEEEPRVYIPADTVHTVDRIGLPERFVTLHCSSNEVSRDWTPEKWRLLARRLMVELQVAVVEVGLKPLLELDAGSERYVNLCGSLSLLETTEVIRRARVFIGIDSGPAHLANASGTFGVILLGEYRVFKSYMPYSGRYKSGENANVLHQDGPAADIPVDQVFDAVKKRLDVVNGDPA
jgi:heptosyltransferase III